MEIRQDVKKFDINEFSKNIKNNYSISASAGTGKTYNIIEIVQKLKEHQINEDEILIVTYTEKAAGELKTRIKEQVKGFNVDNAHIGTIHSFCKDTIAEFYYTMGLPSKLNVVDDSKIQSLYDKFIRDCLFQKKIEVNLIRNSESKGDLKTIINKLYLDKDGNIDPNIISFNTPDKPVLQKTLDGIHTLIGKTETEIYQYFLDYNDESDLEYTKKVHEAFDRLYKVSNEYLERQKAVNPSIQSLKALAEEINKKNKKNDEDKIVLIWQSLSNSIINNGTVSYRNFKVEGISDILSSLKNNNKENIVYYKDIAIELYRKWQEEKRRNKWFTFNDMLREVRESIVSDNGLLKEKLRKKYKYALIDEFQDTNQLQWDIFKKVFLESDDNFLIVVGDRKQSIYSFQGADLTVYDNAIAAIKAKGGFLRELVDNYRSSKAMIDSYNKLFTMKNFHSLNYTNPVGVGFEKLNATFDGNSIKGLNIVLNKKDGITSPVTPYEYARMIVQMITNYCMKDKDGKTRLQVYDKSGKPHNVSFKDFMILGKSRSEFYAIEYELKQVGIPFVKYKDDKLFVGMECAHWIALINAILKRDFTGSNRSAFRKALFTKFFGKTLREISSPVYETDSTNEMALILKWKNLADDFNYTELINSIYEDSGIEKRMTSLTDIQSLNVFKQIGDYSLNYLLAGNSLAELKNNLIRLNSGESDDEIEGGTIVEKGTDFDCVELMTMHASKGLDRKIVFIVGGEAKKYKKGSTVGIYHKNEIMEDGSETTRAYLTMDDKKYSNEAKEEVDRLFYVAYTRAKYQVVLPYYKENKDISVIQTTKELIDTDENMDFYTEVIYDKSSFDILEIKEKVNAIIKSNSASDDESEEDKTRQINLLKSISNNMNKHCLFKHSYASMSKIKEDKEVLDDKLLANKEGNPLEEVLSGFDLSSIPVNLNYSDHEPKTIPDRFPKGAVIGTTLHEIFENFEFTAIENCDNNLSYVISDRFKANNINDNPVFLEYVNDIVNNVLNAKLPIIKGNKIDTSKYFKLKDIDSSDRKAEAEFNFGVEEFDLSNYCNGFIDLLFRRGDYYCILDWKSDTINDNDLLSYNKLEDIKKRVDGHYSIQRVLYSYTLINWLYSCNMGSSKQEVFNNHFGGIYYVFIRGCIKDTANGIYAQTWNSYEDLEKEYNQIIEVVKRGGLKLKGGNSNEE